MRGADSFEGEFHLKVSSVSALPERMSRTVLGKRFMT